MMGEKGKTQEDTRCNKAATVIRDLIKHECQGFILPPSEVKRLLGIPGYYQTWYLHKKIITLRKALANNYISMAVSPEYGICITLYKVPRDTYVRFSPRN
ncbi:MAG: hypothetical protein JXM72_08635 [Deltaproteobacteria bacterium]|nr:hypothetical protein [Deltaproteobacteria bacterium]